MFGSHEEEVLYTSENTMKPCAPDYEKMIANTDREILKINLAFAGLEGMPYLNCDQRHIDIILGALYRKKRELENNREGYMDEMEKTDDR